MYVWNVWCWLELTGNAKLVKGIHVSKSQKPTSERRLGMKNEFMIWGLNTSNIVR